MIPYFVFHTVSGFLAPIDLLGFALTCILLVVGLVGEFGLDRKIVIRVMAAVGFTFFVAWSVNQFKSSGKPAIDDHAPKNLDDLERDVRK